ncbi:ComEC/Rec2 family competence protein [Shigella sonnei]
MAAGLIRGGQVFLPGCWIDWQMPLIGGICCAAYATLTGMQPPALRTVVALAIWGMLKLSGRQWSGWDMDMLSGGGNFADGSCCHSLAMFMAICRCGRGTD